MTENGITERDRLSMSKYNVQRVTHIYTIYAICTEESIANNLMDSWEFPGLSKIAAWPM